MSVEGSALFSPFNLMAFAFPSRSALAATDLIIKQALHQLLLPMHQLQSLPTSSALLFLGVMGVTPSFPVPLCSLSFASNFFPATTEDLTMFSSSLEILIQCAFSDLDPKGRDPAALYPPLPSRYPGLWSNTKTC